MDCILVYRDCCKSGGGENRTVNFSCHLGGSDISHIGGKEVAIGRVSRRQAVMLVAFTVAVTTVFYFILRFFETPNLIFSTLSIATSFVAASLTIMRSPFFAMAYASNEVVLIILWFLATIANPEYVPVIVNFAIFLINDMYGFFKWKAKGDSLKKSL